MKKVRFEFGDFQTFQQAWCAMLKGYLVRRRGWPEKVYYILNDSETMYGDVHFEMIDMSAEQGTSTSQCDNITPVDILCADWEITRYTWKKI